MKDVYRYGSELTSHDLLKIVAISTMVIDHIGLYLLANNVWFRVIGRMAAPQFFFLVGYSGSYRFKSEILYFGIALSAINYLTNTSASLAENMLPLNILICFTLIKTILNKWDIPKLPTGSLILLLAVLMLFSLPTYYLIEYGTLGLSYAIGARLVNLRHRLRHLWLGAAAAFHFGLGFVALLVLDPEVPMHLIPFAAVLLAVVFAANLAIFLNYRVRVFKVEQKRLRALALYVSRYSLEIYFFHLSALMIIHYL